MPSTRTKVGNLIGQGLVCKTSVGGFDSRSDLHFKLWPCGGIGRHTGFRNQRLRVSRFKSERGYHSLSNVSVTRPITVRGPVFYANQVTAV